MKIIGSGSKSSSSSNRPAREDSDTLQSTSYAQIIDLICEGEIEGLVDGLHSIYLDDTPLLNSSGEENFNGISVDTRNGTQDQTYIKGFPSSESEKSVNVEVRKDTPVIRTITDSNINAVNVRLSVPQLTLTDNRTGDIKGTEVSLAIDVNTDDAGWVEKLTDTIIGKCSSKFQKSYKVYLSGGSNYQVRVRRITDDSSSSYLQNKIYWDSYGEVIDAKLSYPNSALMALKIDASSFQNIPTRSYELRLLKIKVPYNYDPEKRTYSGIWDGTFKVAWSNNPAWVFYDLLINDRYGAGIDESYVDKWSLYTIGRYCDEFVFDGYGKTEPRFTCNLYLQTRDDAYKVIRDLASVFRGICFWQNGLLTAIQDMPSDISYLFNNSNVIDGEFTYQGTSKSKRYTVALVTWNDPSDMYRQKVEYVEDSDGISKYGVIQTEVVAIGCSSRGQAHRFGRWIICSSLYETETVTFSTGIEAANVRPGQLIKVQDEMRAGVRAGGRVISASSDQILIDKEISFDPGIELSISVMLPNCVVEKKSILSIEGNTVTVSSSFSEIPHKYSTWIISSNVIEPQLFKVVGVTESDNKYTINALKYHIEKYDYIENSLKLEESEISLLNVSPDMPLDLKVVENLYESNGEIKVKAIFSWKSVINAASYSIEYKKENGNLISLGETKANEIEIFNIDPGAYEFYVQSKSVFGVKSQKSKITYEILGKALPPGNVENLSMIPVGKMAYFSWDKSVDLDVIIGGVIRIRYSPNENCIWNDSVDVAILPGNSTKAQAPLLNGYYLAKFFDSSGNSSSDETIIQTTMLEPSALNVVYTVDEHPLFAGEKSNLKYSELIGGLVLDSQKTIDQWTGNIDSISYFDFLGYVYSYGEYYFDEIVDLTEVYFVDVYADIEVYSFDVSDTIDSRSENIDRWPKFDSVVINDTNAEIYMRTTEDDPSDPDAVWTDWTQFFIGQYKGRGFQFKVLVISDSQDHAIAIKKLSVSIDLPDRIVDEKDILSFTGVYSVVFEKPFAAIPAIGITAHDMNTGDYYVITNKTKSGFSITFYDSSNNYISRTFDYIAKGYGRSI